MIVVKSLTATVLAVLLAGSTTDPQFKHQTSGTTAQLRGISAANSKIGWASGSKGTFLRTINGGQTWHSGVVPAASALDFRDVQAIDATTAYLLATGGRIYKTTNGGRRWSLQYNNPGEGVFLDAFAFWDARHGIVLGDPIKDSFLLLITNDGGVTWKQVPSPAIPPAIKGEAAFAASGTCLAVEGKNNVWFATGGKAARVFRSTDRGRTWKVSNTPIVSGEDSTGIFSIAFKDAKNGFIVGGDYRKPMAIGNNVARTTDGGETWKLVEGARPNGFRSCVEYVGRTPTLIAVGEKACDYSTDDGATWKSFGKEGYHAISVAASGKGWAVGADGRIAAISFTKSD